MTRLVAVLSLTLLVVACKPSQPAAPEPKPAAVVAAQPASAPAAAPVPVPEAKPHAMEGCGHPSPDPIQHPDSVTVKDPTTGATVTQSGAKLAGAALVKVADLLAKPTEYAGKTVRLEGNVSSMCFHRRDWFSLQDEGAKGVFVRVVTAPAFLVPEGSIGKKARAEGVVEVVEVPAATAKHYAEGHQLGDGKDVQGPVKSVVIKAVGAEFI